VTTAIAGLPFWQLTFDADGNPDPASGDPLIADVKSKGLTDLVVFAHGWNNDQGTAMRLYQAFFSLLAGQLSAAPAGTVLGLAGVLWPSELWPDEPPPDFGPAAAAAPLGGLGGAGLVEAADDDEGADPALDQATLNRLHSMFPAAKAELDEIAAVLTGPVTAAAQADLLTKLKDLSAALGDARDDGENESTPTGPPMLVDSDAEALFDTYRNALSDLGLSFGGSGSGGGAGLTDNLRGIWNGAKEALRQTTYWHMKARAGVVGRAGLGPLIGRIHAALPQLRIHLVGHSFGARLVSYTLAGLPDLPDGSPVKAVTLLEGAFSHNVFADPLPYDQSRKGDLAGMLTRIDGPLVACFSSFDSSVGTLYPLASFAARQDTAGLAPQVDQQRWGGMGSDGVQGLTATLVPIGDAGPGTTYPFVKGTALNIDASRVVRNGKAPAGAHSDIVHAELTRVVLLAGGLVK
jgi:hypothetical protein